MTGRRAPWLVAAAALLGIAVVVLSGFNGRWIPGRDSALYRSVARSLQAGDGYSFRGDQESLAYPGMPLYLAATDRADSLAEPRGALLGIALIGIAATFAVFAWVRREQGLLPAAAAAVIVGCNATFLSYCHELLAEIPFVAAVAAALWAAGQMESPPTRASRAAPVVATVALLVALLAKPAFWALAVGWGAWAIGHWLGGRRRIAAAAASCLVLAVMIGAVIAFGLRGVSWWNDGYAEAVAANLSSPPGPIDNLGQLVMHGLPTVLFGRGVAWPFALVGVALALASLVIYARRRPLPGVYAGLWIAVVVAIGCRPRHLLVLLPVLAAAGVYAARAALERVPRGRGLLATLWLLLYLTPNAVAGAHLIAQQRAGGAPRGPVAAGLWRLQRELPRWVAVGEIVRSPEPRLGTLASHRLVFGPCEQPPHPPDWVIERVGVTRPAPLFAIERDGWVLRRARPHERVPVPCAFGGYVRP